MHVFFGSVHASDALPEAARLYIVAASSEDEVRTLIRKHIGSADFSCEITPSQDGTYECSNALIIAWSDGHRLMRAP